MKRQRNYSQLKNQEKIHGKKSETKINNLSDNEYKAVIMKVLTELGKRVDLQSDNF